MHIETVIDGIETSDGAGVRLTRMIGTPKADMIDPFLMLDRFDNEDPGAYIGGFPDHPHRGFETVTLMLDGRMRHRDSTGGAGVIGPGDVQWMTAGRGIIHSEMPEQIEGRMRGFQLWVNLPAAQKMTAPGYQDITAGIIPAVEGDGITIRVIAGTLDGTEGPARAQTPIRLLQADMAPGARFNVTSPDGHNAFFCLFEGTVDGEDERGARRAVEAASLGILGGDGPLTLTAGPEGASLLYGEGQPINEPVARYGPFVMNTERELMEAVHDYQSGRFVA